MIDDLETRTRLLAGQDTWSLPAVPEIGLESLVMSDGPIGVRGAEWRGADTSIALPSPSAMAATWDVDLIRRAGNLLAQEARRKGVHVLLAPTVNLHRSPLGGRHFECFSEDPLLTGEIGAAYVSGVQEGGVGVTVKHFVANDSETDRMTVDVLVGERALRELYLAPFEHIVKKASPFGIMAAYNGVNGSPMTENGPLQNDVLRGEWGFDGVIVSDWSAAKNTVRAALGGLDVAMPGPVTVFGEALAEAVQNQEVPEEVVDAQVSRVLKLAARVGALGEAPKIAAGKLDGAALARELAARSATLLVNDGVLPLRPDAGIALLGGLAKDARVMGGGSAQVFPDHVISPLDGLLHAGASVTYARGADASDRFRTAGDGFDLRVLVRDAAGAILAELPIPDGLIMWMGELPGGLDATSIHSVEITGTFAPTAPGRHAFGVEGAGRHRLVVDDRVLFDGDVALADLSDPVGNIFLPPQNEFAIDVDGPVEVSLLHTRPPFLSEGLFPAVVFALGHRAPDAMRDPDVLLEEAVAAAATAEVAVVVVGTSKEVESEGFDRTSLRLPGRQDELVSRVAAANSQTVVVVNAGAPVEMPWRNEVAAILLTWFPGQEGGHALADVLLGRAEPGGRLPTTWPATLADCPVSQVTPENGTLFYDEGVFVGYRAWGRTATAPAFPFGAGQGYTSWDYEDAWRQDDSVIVRVRNTGDRPGREVVQVYLRPLSENSDLPSRWLAGFAVTAAGPGESTEVAIHIPERAYQSWTADGWRRISDAWVIEVSHSLHDTRLVIE